MTLQDLIDALSDLPASARTATVILQNAIDEGEVLGVAYQGGEVLIECNLELSEGTIDDSKDGDDSKKDDA